MVAIMTEQMNIFHYNWDNAKACDQILSYMELAGMLPPQTSKPISDYNLDALQALTKAYHKWEKE
jgi:hypothetical protein